MSYPVPTLAAGTALLPPPARRRAPGGRRSRLAKLLLLLLWTLTAGVLAPGRAAGQAGPAAQAAQALARHSRQRPVEKLFLHLDRPSYVSGETMWFKVYVAEGSSHQPLATSSVAYVEVLDAAQKPVLQAKILLREASGRGSFVLPATLATGSYTVRAYTNWMKNAGPALYFHSPVRIVNTRTPLLPPPVLAAAAPDAQFFPEGGHLVQGIGSRLGFKIADANGQGLEAEGSVVDEAGTSVARFKTLKFGLGSFSFTPAQAGKSYRAIIRLSNQQTFTAPLPAIQAQGYVLRLEEAGPSQLRLAVLASGAGRSTETMVVLAHARGRVALATTMPLLDGRAELLVDKAALAEGISHFTVFNSRQQPVCERLYFTRPSSGLALAVQADKALYAAREQVSLRVLAGTAAAPAPANLSVAVYQLDSLSAGPEAAIGSYLWLTSDLRGQVENPEYYLRAEAATAADNLMLTQGWSRFSWAAVLAGKPDSVRYLPEVNGPLLQGRVRNRDTGAPATNIPVYLTSPSRRIQLYNAVSRADGSIQFEVPDWYGSHQLVLQTDTKRDSLYQVELLSSFSAPPASHRPAPFRPTEQLAASLARRHAQAQVQQRFSAAAPVRYLAPRPADSVAFYGRPNEQYRLDDYTRFRVMEEVMREYVPGVLVRIRKDGFHFIVPDNNAKTLSENPLVLLDGMPVFNINRIMAFDPLKVQKLDVVTNRFLQGALTYNGIVSYTTYKGDLAGFAPDSRALLAAYEGLQGQREFYAPRYDTPLARQSRQPDFRNLLYWNPEVRPAPGSPTELRFFTADQAGTYRVVVHGLAANGQAGSTSFTFEVKSAL